MESTAGRLAWSGRWFAWGGALLFVCSLSDFLFAYAFTFRETQQASPAAPAILVNLLLFTGFALHHSVFARERVRAWVARTVPAPLERSFYVWIASLLFIAVCTLWQPVGGVAWSVPPPLGWLLYTLLAAGVWLSVGSARVIDVWELAGVRQAGLKPPVRSQQPEELTFKTSGPYGLVRHPIYLGWFLMVFGVPTMTMTRLVFAVISCAYLVMAIPLEERTLRRTTAGKYDEYIRLVRWRIVPGVY